jgi:hypothetical protein
MTNLEKHHNYEIREKNSKNFQTTITNMVKEDFKRIYRMKLFVILDLFTI